MGKGVVGQGALGIDVVLDDLADRIRLDQVHALKCGHDCLFRGGEGRRHRHQAGVATALCGGVVGGLAQLGQPALTPSRNGFVLRPRHQGPCPHPRPRWPGRMPRQIGAGEPARVFLSLLPLVSAGARFAQVRGLEAGLATSLGELPAGGHTHLDDINAFADAGSRLSRRSPDFRRGQDRPQQRLLRHAQHLAHFPRHRRVCIELSQGRADQPRRMTLGGHQPVWPGEQLSLQGKVHGPGRHVQGKLSRGALVLQQCHRERQQYPARQQLRMRAAVALDQRRRQWTTGPVQAIDPEHAQYGPLLRDRGRPVGRLREPHSQV